VVSLRAVLPAGLVSALAFCLVFGEEPARKKGTKMTDPLQLTANFQIQGRELVLDYQVTNRSMRDVYLLNRLFRTTPQWTMTPDIIYIQFDSATETVWLNKKLADLPAGIAVTAPVAPYVSPVRAGGTFREQVRIPLPVSEYTQYGPVAEQKSEPPAMRTFKQVHFSVDYYWKPDGTIEETRDIQGTPVVFPVTPAGKPLQFGQIRTPLVRMSIPVQLP
jgi:hypothetical protein